MNFIISSPLYKKITVSVTWKGPPEISCQQEQRSSEQVPTQLPYRFMFCWNTLPSICYTSFFHCIFQLKAEDAWSVMVDVEIWTFSRDEYCSFIFKFMDVSENLMLGSFLCCQENYLEINMKDNLVTNNLMNTDLLDITEKES